MLMVFAGKNGDIPQSTAMLVYRRVDTARMRTCGWSCSSVVTPTTLHCWSRKSIKVDGFWTIFDAENERPEPKVMVLWVPDDFQCFSMFNEFWMNQRFIFKGVLVIHS